MTEMRPIYVISLRPEKGTDPIRSLRWLLKAALRHYGFRCVSVELQDTTTTEGSTT